MLRNLAPVVIMDIRRATPEKQRFGRATPAKKTDTWVGVRCMDCGREKWPLRRDVTDPHAYRCRSCRKKCDLCQRDGETPQS